MGISEEVVAQEEEGVLGSGIKKGKTGLKKKKNPPKKMRREKKEGEIGKVDGEPERRRTS